MGVIEKSTTLLKDVLSSTATTLGKLSGRVIGTPVGFTEVLTKAVSRQIGQTLLDKMTLGSDLNCIRNPYSRRYEDPDNVGGNYNFGFPDSPLIGQMYDIYYHEEQRHDFLDRKKACDLMGYTHLQAAAEERSGNFYLDKLYTISTYIPFINPDTNLADIPIWVNLNESPKRYTPSSPYGIEKLTTIPTSVAPNGHIHIFNNYFEIYTTDSVPLSSKKVNILSRNFGESTLQSDGNGGVTSSVYNELGQEFQDAENSVSTIDGDTGSNLKDITGLLGKTNKLFYDSKVESLINRFKTGVQNGENETSIIQSAVGPNGLSRGRNLTSTKTQTFNGYDDPYCRVWTSHHQYGRYKDTIRPLNGNPDEKNGGKEYFTQGDGFRPIEGGKRLKNMSVLNFKNKANKVNITPSKDRQDIKNCMFSIENLAWKDINMNARVTDKGGSKVIGKTLTKEQQGPNGGRIMWFPPYNLKFSEQISTQWNDNTFIGRGEKVYTYANTERRGQLDFTLLVDHPMIINQLAQEEGDYDTDLQILRYFAGCGDGLEIKYDDGKTNYTEKEEVVINGAADLDLELENLVLEENKMDEDEAQEISFKSIFFFPNNFSGEGYEPDEAMDILLNQGVYENGTKGYENSIGSNVTGMTYENGMDGKQWTSPSSSKWGAQHPWVYTTNRENKYQSWYYAIDREKTEEKLPDSNREDSSLYGLNGSLFPDFIVDRAHILGFSGDTAWTGNRAEVQSTLFSELSDFPLNRVISAKDIVGGKVDKIKQALENEICPNTLYNISVEVNGYASKDGSSNLNQTLSERRAKMIGTWMEKCSNLGLKSEDIITKGNGELTRDSSGVSGLKGKISRCAILTIKFSPQEKYQEPTYDLNTEKETLSVNGDDPLQIENVKIRAYTSESEAQIDTYDDEYKYFKDLTSESPLVYKYISDKVKYFDPAFHSITPEGFNARLTFLHQCTRQGPTLAASDSEQNGQSMGAGNLAFGRAPFCILRIGDFYNTKICIDNINIQYENDGGINWDLNPEGIGVQPMFANISLSFRFLGGSDLSGPIDRLQNAVSYNYYANTSIYDRRADFRDRTKTVDSDEFLYSWSPVLNKETEVDSTERVRTEKIVENHDLKNVSKIDTPKAYVENTKEILPKLK